MADQDHSQRGSGPPDDELWLLRRRTTERLFRALVGLCVLLGAADLFYHRHVVYSFEEVPVAYGLFGFVSFVFIIFAGRALRRVIMRDEDYYER